VSNREGADGVLKDESLNHQRAVSFAMSDPPTVGSSDHFDSVAQKRLPLGAELQFALDLIPAHALVRVPVRDAHFPE
jgi:hypothetical protein